MAMTQVTIKGKLGATFGRSFNLDVNSPAEVIRALCALRPGFEKYMMDASKLGLRFAVCKGKRNIALDEFAHGHGENKITIFCLATGAKRGGLTQIFVGAALIVASFFTAGAAAAIGFSAAAAATAATAVMGMGISLAMGGVIQLLSPQPKGMSMSQDPDNKPSYAFGGPVNTTAMGNPVGVCYGLREVGGAIISAGIIAEDVRV